MLREDRLGVPLVLDWKRSLHPREVVLAYNVHIDVLVLWVLQLEILKSILDWKFLLTYLVRKFALGRAILVVKLSHWNHNFPAALILGLLLFLKILGRGWNQRSYLTGLTRAKNDAAAFVNQLLPFPNKCIIQVSKLRIPHVVSLHTARFAFEVVYSSAPT